MSLSFDISIVLSCFNDELRVEEAIGSIQPQSLSKWELIAINDGSTDKTGKILDQFAAQDTRIHVIHQQKTGLTRALILGCEQARGKYIARQDADDRSHPQRLAEQVKMLESDSEIGFASCWTEYVGPADEPLVIMRRPEDSREATRGLLNERLGPSAHGNVMFRKSIYEQVGRYRPEFYYGQDSDLWLRMAEVSRGSY